MKNLLRTCFMVITLLALTACTHNIDFNNSKETLEFSFRAGGELAGAKLKVSLERKGQVTSQEQIIKESDKSVNFSFGEMESGEDINIKAVLIMGNVELYRGSKAVTIQAGENKVNLELELASVNLTLSPGNIKLSDYDLKDAFFRVTVNGQKIVAVPIENGVKDVRVKIGYREIGSPINVTGQIYKMVDGKEVIIYNVETSHVVTKDDKDVIIDMNQINAFLKIYPADFTFSNGKFFVSINGGNERYVTINPDSPVSMDAGVFSVGDEITIDGRIENDLSEICYLSSQKYVVAEGDSIAHLSMTPFHGAFIWKTNKGYNKSDFVFDITKKNSLENYDLLSGTTIDNNNGLTDFAFDNDGNVWTLYSRNDSSLAYHVSCRLTGGISASCELNESVITAFHNGMLAVGDLSDGSGMTFVLLTKGVDNTINSQPINNTGYTYNGDLEMVSISSITASGNNVYLAATVVTDTDTKLRLIKFVYDEADNTLKFVSSKDITYADTNIPSITATDMELAGDDLFILVLDDSKNKKQGDINDSNVSRGGLLRVNPSTLDFVSKLGVAPEHYCRNDEDAQKYFVGPRKFVAIKPKKLVIADGGCISDTDDVYISDINLRKRIITVDIEKFAFDKIESLGTDMLEGGISLNVSGAYDLQLSM